ncbi:hypothetical protein [Streptococcus mutans]|uniref:hypothetical protein n=1 Tax=Streptococcus mutans TaxID=1309 RepID=UPI0002B57DF5|nr:hypothetical protein [Streptococcus mutans]EMC47098.1 phage protein [Streptococcus mutans 24]
MSENIKEALEYSVDLAAKEQKTIEVNGKYYFDSNQFRLVELEPRRYPKCVDLNTLDSLIDYLKSDHDLINKKHLMVLVKSPLEIEVYEEIDSLQHRPQLIYVEALTPHIEFGKYFNSQDFNIYLQSLFIDDEDRELVLNFASALKIDNGSEIVDNGVSQTATVKTGVASLSKAKAPNPVILRPYRTFGEVEQPASPFIFRINSLGQMALFEADGGKWRLEAINNIADYLKKQLADNDKITILA